MLPQRSEPLQLLQHGPLSKAPRLPELPKRETGIAESWSSDQPDAQLHHNCASEGRVKTGEGTED